MIAVLGSEELEGRRKWWKDDRTSSTIWSYEGAMATRCRCTAPLHGTATHQVPRQRCDLDLLDLLAMQGQVAQAHERNGENEVINTFRK